METNYKKTMAEAIVDELKKDTEYISDFLFKNPELGGEEFLSSMYLVSYLEKEGFQIQYPYAGEKTGFKAEKTNGFGPTIAFLAEYDALPGYGPEGENGHACGHNWIAAVTVGAAVALGRMIDHIKGTVVVIGTPAEETYGGKVTMAEQGGFEGLDIVMQAHLEEQTDISANALAYDSFRFEFTGLAAHAAQYPHRGINALDGVLQTFSGINALRQQLADDIRVHGIITNGGQALNSIPHTGVCEFGVRGRSRTKVTETSKKVLDCAKGAALMTGTTLAVSHPESSMDNIVTNSVLLKLAEENMKSLGFGQLYRTDDQVPGSTDIGNVSNIVPTLYMEIGLDDGLVFSVHDVKALQYANSLPAYKKMNQVIKSLVYIAIDIFENPEKAREAKKELKEKLEQM